MTVPNLAKMDQDWILQTKETRRFFSGATWVPLRASCNEEQGEVHDIGYVSEFFGCGSVAFPPEHRDFSERLSWDDIGINCSVQPYAYKDGYYSSIEQYQYRYNEEEQIGVHLVFEHPQPVVEKMLWILNPDLVVALHLIKDGTNWVRPEENFVVVAREVIREEEGHRRIEIKREFLLDYLSARNISLRLSYFRQRVVNVASLEGSVYENLADRKEQRDGGRFEILIRSLENVYGGSQILTRVWRTDVDEDEDAPVMVPEIDGNTDCEISQGYLSGYEGVRVGSEFFRDEWIEHQGQSVRVRGDADRTLPEFIVETDGTRMASANLYNRNRQGWLWFNSRVVKDFLLSGIRRRQVVFDPPLGV